MTLSEVVELMHVSTQIHDTVRAISCSCCDRFLLMRCIVPQVLEDFNDLRKGNAAHRLYGSTSAGNKVRHGNAKVRFAASVFFCQFCS